MNSIAVIVSTDKPKDFFRDFSTWGPKVDWKKSILILVNSGEDIKNELDIFAIESGINLTYLQGLKCPISKRNEGAKVAAKLGFDYVVFLNDYQKLEAKSLQNFLALDRKEKVTIGKVELSGRNGLPAGKIYKEELVLNRNSSISNKWELFSRVSESGLIFNTSYFLRLGGWAWAKRENETFIGGDGFLLLARTFVDGESIGTCNDFRVLGGHLNPNSDSRIIRSKAAMYSYAFTIATLYPGVPKWLAARFIIGRMFRTIQFSLSMKKSSELYPVVDLAARLRAFFGLQPSKFSQDIREIGLKNCSLSEFACSGNLAEKCIFPPNYQSS